MDCRVAVSRASQVLAFVGMLSLCGVVYSVGPPAGGLQINAPAINKLGGAGGAGGLTTTGTCYFGYFGGANGPAGRGFAGGAMTFYPIYMNDGVVIERTQDVGISGLTFGWSHMREYGSLLTGLSGVEQTQENGMRWKTSGIGPYVRLSGSDLELYGSVATKRLFVSSGATTFTSPTKYDGTFLKTGSGPDSYTLTDDLTGQITKFDGLDPGTTNQGRINRFRSREFETSSQPGASFAYSATHGNVTNVTTPQGSSVAYAYVVGGFEADRISKVEVKNSGGTVIQKSEYLYYGTATSPHANTGHYGDLLQVKVSTLNTDNSTWDVKTTQHRYFTAGQYHQVKMVLEPDAIEQITSAGNATVDTPEEIMQQSDAYVVAGGKKIEDYASRSFTYYTADASTASIATPWVPGGENLHSKYGGSEADEYEWYTYGKVKSETVRSGGAGGCCGGSGGSGITLTYFYMTLNGGTSTDSSVVTRLVVEDKQNSSGTAVSRTIRGLNTDGAVLREALIENPSAGTLKAWCNSTKLDANGRVTESRSPSAHTTITSNANLTKFLNPTSGTNDADTLDNANGLVQVNEYTVASGRVTSVASKVKKGENGTGYYTSYTKYGDGTNDKPTWLPIETRVYDTKVTSSPATNGHATTYSYTFHDTGDTQIKIKTTTLPAITTGQNGSGTATTEQEYYDNLGRLRWTKDGEGYVDYFSYHPNTGGLAYQVKDVNTTSLSSEITSGSAGKWVAWSGSAGLTRSTGIVNPALGLISKTEYDDLGRTRLQIDSAGNKHYIVYENGRTLQFPYWNVTASLRLVPISATVTNDGGQPIETYQIDPDRALVSGSDPAGLSAGTTQAHYVSWSKNSYDSISGALKQVDSYHDIPSSGSGVLSTNFHRTLFQYDAEGRKQYEIQISSGTSVSVGVEQVTKYTYDVLSRVTQVERGVSSAAASMGTSYTTYPTLRIVSASVYDSGGVGDGYVTKAKRYFGTGTNDFTGANQHYNFRGQLRGVEPFYMNVSTETVVGPFPVIDYNWRGAQSASAKYTTNQTWATVIGDDTYTTLHPTNREGFTTTLYDKLGRVYESRRYNGSLFLKTSTFYDRNGQQVAIAPNDQTATEVAYDGAGRQYQTRQVAALNATKYTSGAFNYLNPKPESAMASFLGNGGDNLIYSVNHQEFDVAGNAIASHSFEMAHNDAAIGIDVSNHDDYVRQTVYNWYDTANRLTHTGNYGSGDTAAGDGNWKYAAVPTRPSSPPSASSATVLMTKVEYDPDSGRQIKTTHWSTGSKTHVTRTWQDDLGRQTFVAENYVNFSPPSSNSGGTDKSEDRVTAFEYNGLSKLTKLTAMDQNGDGNVSDNQQTKYLFEDTVDAGLVTNEIYPDSADTTSSGSDQIKYTYNVDGSRSGRMDQNGTVMTYSYNSRRQLETDSAATLGTGVDGYVRSIKRTYDTEARIEKVTSYASASGTGTVLNEVQLAYNDFDQVITSYQSHSGAVNVGTSPKVQYSYDPAQVSSAYTRSHRLDKVTHPSGRATFYGYNTGTANSIHNRSGLIRELRQTSSGGTQYAQYDYTGSGRLAIVDYQAPNIKLDYYQGTGTTYAGYDRFGRIKDQFWDGYSGTSDVSRVKHGYDYAGNRLWREDVIADNNYQQHDELYTYDGLLRLVDSQRGDLNAGKTAVTSKNFAQNWTLDALGNWGPFKQDDNGDSTWDLDQPRTHNLANELTTIAATTGPNWADCVCDAAGNMTTVPNPSNLTVGMTLTYDAWNRLVKANTGGTVHAEFRYDGLNHRTIKYDGSSSSPNATYDYYYNSNWQVLEVRKNGNVNPLEAFAWHPYYIDALAVRFYDSDINGSQVDHYYAQDANFNVVAVNSSSGAVQERYRYSAYGELTVLDANFNDDADGVSDIANGVGYTGRLFDPETGLDYYRNRYHDAVLGRFSTRDPIGFKGSRWNLYEYVGAEPMGRRDPMGLAYAPQRRCCGGKSYTWTISNNKACCGNEKEGEVYDRTTSCCENGVVVARVSIWVCDRDVGGIWGYIPGFPHHKYVCCDGPNLNCFGHQNNDGVAGDPIPSEGLPTGNCQERKVCPRLKRLKCMNPIAPCDSDTFTWNCRFWAECGESAFPSDHPICEGPFSPAQ